MSMPFFNTFILRFLLPVLAWFSYANMLQAQQYSSKLDSLTQLYAATSDDSLKLAVNNQIIWQYLFQDQEKAWHYIKISEQLAMKPHQTFGEISLINIKGIYFDVKGEGDSALFYFEKAVELSKKHNIRTHYEHGLNNLGLYYWNHGKLEQALTYFLASKKVNEELNAGKGNINDNLLNNIGLVYQEMFLFEKALTYHLQAYEIRKEREPAAPLIASLNNLGICYKELDMLDSAKYYLQQGIAYHQQAKDEVGYYKLLSTLAGCYVIEKNYTKALQLARAVAHKPGHVPSNNLDKTRSYNSLAHLFVYTNNADSSLYYGLKAKEIMEADSDLVNLVPDLYLALANAYLLKGNIEESSQMNHAYQNALEKIFNKESAETLQELEVKYESEKKDKELMASKLKIAEQDRRRNLILITAAFCLLILLTVFNHQRLKNRRLKTEAQLKEAMHSIEVQNQLQKQRIEISRNLHDTLGAQLTFIISVIDNLKIFDLGREKLIIKYDQLSDFTRNSITELRDTIWAMNKEQISFEDLKSRVSNFVHQAKETITLTHFSFDYPENSAITFDSKKGIEVFRIIQEAVNNAIKHAQASQIAITISEEQNQLQIAIKDNGIGYDASTGSHGNGIKSMQSRALTIGADLSWEKLNPGTAVVLLLKKN